MALDASSDSASSNHWSAVCLEQAKSLVLLFAMVWLETTQATLGEHNKKRKRCGGTGVRISHNPMGRRLKPLAMAGTW